MLVGGYKQSEGGKEPMRAIFMGNEFPENGLELIDREWLFEYAEHFDIACGGQF